MNNRGHVNIAVADSLIDINKNYKNNLEQEQKRNNSIIGQDGINHIIIGRLYYGIYLLAKKDLGRNDRDYLSHKFPHNRCSSYNNGYCNNRLWINGRQCRYYRNRTNGNLCEKYKVVWDLISKKYNDIGLYSCGIQLAELRELYEYQGLVCSDVAVQNARGYFEYIYKIIK